MAALEELTKGAVVRGVRADGPVTVVQAEWHGSGALTLTYTDAAGDVAQELLYRDKEPLLSVDQAGPAWSLDADPHLFRLASEARRISLAHLFDPYLAAQTSNVEPLPHQIEAVYGEMLPRQPLRFLLADDPGAGKTIMAGLFIKELKIRGDVARCLIVAPGSLVDQWQDELWDRFGLHFEILTRDMIEATRSQNPFAERPLLIARLDHLSRNDELQAKLATSDDWDLVVVDEAHKMSATYYGGERKETKRYKLGRLLGGLTRHLLLMTATPHNGKDEDFQAFMALLDGDRFEGKLRDGAHVADASDLMRRLVKEELLRFDGTPLFPERRAYSPTFPLSPLEAALYQQVTEYVREEMNRADRLRREGDGRRGAVVGFALTTLQRRLASSPEAIHQSVVRRRKRLEARLAEERMHKRGRDESDRLGISLTPSSNRARVIDEDFDEEDLTDEELEDLEDEVVDEASAARTIAELQAELATLGQLEALTERVRASGEDTKWNELASMLQDTPEMFDAPGNRRKLIVFTEHRDTLNYLVDRLRRLLGRAEAVEFIHGGVKREERRKVQERFAQDREVVVLVATDAAGEGINLQQANLMVNYDLPWNPNRIEQRFGRIHRIGQTEVCHLWNLVAEDTREGQVFARLFEKLAEQRNALGDQVFDVLGEAFRDKSLRDLLIDAVRYGQDPIHQQRLKLVVDASVGERLTELVRERAQASEVMTGADIERIREHMDRAEARKLQPHFIRSFFLEAFRQLGGRVVERETGRFEITHVPADLRRRDRAIGEGAPLLRRYERVTFERDLMHVAGKPDAELCAPGHPLLDATIDVVIERHGPLLKAGTVLIDPSDRGTTPRVLVYLEHAISDGRPSADNRRRVMSKRFEFTEIDEAGQTHRPGWAPYLDYRPPTPDERAHLDDLTRADWVRKDLDTVALDDAIAHAVPAHLDEVRRRTLDRVDRTREAVQTRLRDEIRYWDHRANQLKEQELAGKQPKLNSGKARARADELQERLDQRLAGLADEANLSALPPVVVGGALVVPAGLLAERTGTDTSKLPIDTEPTERAAVDAVLAAERVLGRTPKEMPRNNKGYDIESKQTDGSLLFIEVKGRAEGADTFMVTASEVGVGRNKPDDHVLALAQVADDGTTTVRYVRRAFDGVGEPPFGTVSHVLRWRDYWDAGTEPS